MTASASSPDRPAPIPGLVADRLLREVGGWLDAPAASGSGTAVPSVPSDGPELRRIIAAHGLGPYLATATHLAGWRLDLPAGLRGWLDGQAGANRARMERLHEELAAILGAFARSGIRAMPLKGAILTTRPGPGQFQRPMADLDLLVDPGDRAAAAAVLEGLGYLARREPHRWSTHDVFDHPDAGLVRSYDGEHPDNPRRVELHVEVRRHLWGWIDDDDLTPGLWASASDGTILGQPAAVPSDEALLAHLAIHATCDLLLGRGRLVQWLDLARLTATASPADTGIPHPRLTFPSIALARRRLPAAFAGVRLEELTAAVPFGLRRWAAHVSLDTACGLEGARFLPADASSLAARWTRWAPRAWRLRVAYGDLPLPLAAARHTARAAGIARRSPV